MSVTESEKLFCTTTDITNFIKDNFKIIVLSEMFMIWKTNIIMITLFWCHNKYI